MQQTLPIEAPAYRGPLCAVATAKGLLDLTEAEIGDLVDVGQLPAFDVRTPEATRRELRLVVAGVAAYLAARQAGDAAALSRWQCPITAATAVGLVLGSVRHDKPWLTGREISRLLNVGRQHTLNLCAAGEMRTQAKGRRGRGGSPVVGREEFRRWLMGRMT